MNILVSACLLGVNCRYDGKGTLNEKLAKSLKKYNFIPICPEILGGLETPREPAERIDNRVVTKSGKDVTKNYNKGAEEVLKLAKLYECNYIILKDRSPSCGYGQVYDGSFNRVLIDGKGITAELLEKNNVSVICESQVNEFLDRE